MPVVTRRTSLRLQEKDTIPSVTQVSPKPSTKRQHRQFKTLFKPRTSLLDFETLVSEKHPMRGFFVLFWLSIAFRVIVTMYQRWREVGSPISTDLAFIMTDKVHLFFSADLTMVLSLFYAPIYQKLITWRVIPLPLARTIQHCIQAAWFLGICAWILATDLQWTQTTTFLLHSIAMLMKQHSYTSYNIDLQYKLRRWKSLQDQHRKSDDELTDEEVQEMEDLRTELCGGGEMFPANQTFANFIDYLLVPSLVYELHFPRTSRFRWWYFFERVGATFTVITLLYMIVEHQINPILVNMPKQTFLDSLMELLLPFMCVYIMVFYLIFDCICNAFAELTCFADREFYGDWWNSSSFGDFARLWNKPVHHFLLRHCYQESLQNLKFSKKDAMLLTFLISSLMHELVFVLIGKRIRLYLFFLQMFQLPLIYMSSFKIFQGRALAGNVFFWFGMYMGPPLLAVCYLREHYA